MSAFCPLPERLAKHSRRDEATGCLVWTGGTRSDGYGAIVVEGKSRGAHRVAYELAHGPIPTMGGAHGAVVMHRCDNRKCIEPAHLTLGSQADNVADAVSKRRHKGPRGESHPRAKLDNSSVEMLRHVYGLGLFSQRQLAKWWGIDKSVVSRVCARVRWRSVD